MSTLRFLAHKTDHVTVVAYQSEHRLANADTDQGLQSAPSSVPVLTDEHMQPYKEVRRHHSSMLTSRRKGLLCGPRVTFSTTPIGTLAEVTAETAAAPRQT